MVIMRNTLQKDIIFTAVKAMNNHPTAEAVYNEVAAMHPNISKATVYRNLNRMADEGVISRLHTPQGADFYDLCTDEHYHMKCERCERIFDLPLEYQYGLCGKLSQQTNFELHRHSLMFFGLCPECKSI